MNLLTVEELKRVWVKVTTGIHHKIAYEAAGIYLLESLCGREEYVTAEKLRNAEIWRRQ